MIGLVCLTITDLPQAGCYGQCSLPVSHQSHSQDFQAREHFLKLRLSTYCLLKSTKTCEFLASANIFKRKNCNIKRQLSTETLDPLNNTPLM